MIVKIVFDGITWFCTAMQAVLFVICAVKWFFANGEIKELSEQGMKELKKGAERGRGGGNICKNTNDDTDASHDTEYLQLAVIRRDALWGHVRMYSFLLASFLVVKLLARSASVL